MGRGTVIYRSLVIAALHVRFELMELGSVLIKIQVVNGVLHNLVDLGPE